MIESVLPELADALIRERQAEAWRQRLSDGRPGPLLAPVACLLVRLGFALDPILRQQLGGRDDELAPVPVLVVR